MSKHIAHGDDNASQKTMNHQNRNKTQTKEQANKYAHLALALGKRTNTYYDVKAS